MKIVIIDRSALPPLCRQDLLRERIEALAIWLKQIDVVHTQVFIAFTPLGIPTKHCDHTGILRMLFDNDGIRYPNCTSCTTTATRGSFSHHPNQGTPVKVSFRRQVFGLDTEGDTYIITRSVLSTLATVQQQRRIPFCDAVILLLDTRPFQLVHEHFLKLPIIRGSRVATPYTTNFCKPDAGAQVSRYQTCAAFGTRCTRSHDPFCLDFYDWCSL